MRIIPKKIMCAVDFSEFTNLTLSYGQALAKEFEAHLTLCHVVSDMVLMSSAGQAYIASEKIEAERRQDAASRLEDIGKTLDMDCDTMVTTGHPADELTRIAEETGVDMVVAATHGGSGVKRFLVGSVTDRLVKTLSCPVLVLHGKAEPGVLPGDRKKLLNRILVGCDFSPDSSLAFQYGLSLAQEFETQLFLAHVVRPTEHVEFSSADYIKVQEGDYLGWNRSDYLGLTRQANDPDAQRHDALRERLERQLARMVPEESRHWCTPVTAVLEGEPYQELLTFAEKNQVDLIVLGVRGHSLLEKFLVGSTTERVISRSGCPVLAVRQTDTDT
ncbi:universal stress protein [Desulfotignum phosphitoxidans]|uniref:Universal stress protein n=1 Tax=Desulfotignum phosphitoxidans DSM 13687 TaxID=1286635 RepID=S0G2H5_9BACT|nr:universal stress protein [Desulfotignum phosphitoxidans]EMS81548.1 universal stress protein [Desulfotignum phosphitoxidans DSM 13687]